MDVWYRYLVKTNISLRINRMAEKGVLLEITFLKIKKKYPQLKPKVFLLNTYKNYKYFNTLIRCC